MSARPCHLSGSGRSDLVSSRSAPTRTDSSPVLVRNSTPLGADDVAHVPALEGLVGVAQRVCCRNSWICPVRSAILAKLALPMTRLRIRRPPTLTRVGFASSHSRAALAVGDRAAAPRAHRGGSRWERRLPCLRSSVSFARRSAISLFSSPAARRRKLSAVMSCHVYTPALSAASMKLVEVAIEHRRRYCRSTPVRRSLMRDWSST